MKAARCTALQSRRPSDVLLKGSGRVTSSVFGLSTARERGEGGRSDLRFSVCLRCVEANDENGENGRRSRDADKRRCDPLAQGASRQRDTVQIRGSSPNMGRILNAMIRAAERAERERRRLVREYERQQRETERQQRHAEQQARKEALAEARAEVARAAAMYQELVEKLISLHKNGAPTVSWGEVANRPGRSCSLRSVRRIRCSLDSLDECVSGGYGWRRVWRVIGLGE